MKPITVLTPTGVLGYGFDPEALVRGMTFKPALIAVDAGSTDPGPYYLGTGEPLAPRIAVERELEQLLTAVVAEGIPLVVGSCGGSGRNDQVAWTVEIVRDLAHEHGWHFRMATIEAEIPIETVLAALPILEGYDAGPATHMGKILECGAFCADPFGMDVILGTLDEQGFTLEPGSLGRRCTVATVAGHSLYERENPYIQAGPGGYVDMTGTQFIQVDERRVRVTGTRFMREEPYRVKLEGVRPSGYRTVSVAGVRCPTMIERIEPILADVRKRMNAYFAGCEAFNLLFHLYGKDAVMGPLGRKINCLPHELGLVTEVIAPTQELAHGICHITTGTLLHYSYEGQKNNAGNLAFLHSPSEIDAGPTYVFSLYHLMEVGNSRALFPMHLEEV